MRDRGADACFRQTRWNLTGSEGIGHIRRRSAPPDPSKGQLIDKRQILRARPSLSQSLKISVRRALQESRDRGHGIKV